MKILVTGASGMLGRTVASTLHARGDVVTVVQRRPAGLDVAEINGDIAEDSVVRRAVADQDAVVHLAAKVDVTGPWADYLRVNVTATQQLLRQARVAGVGQFVYVSSPSVAHSGRALFGQGAAPADPATTRGHYSRSKALAERLALGADGADFATVAVRPHLVWGPGDTQLIGRVVERARTGRLPLIGSGAALIDTTYVSNAADAIVAALDRADLAHGQALVVSNGEPRPVAEIIGRVCAAAGIAAPERQVPYALAYGLGALVDAGFAAWGTVARLAGRPAPSEPPITRFLAEQLATAHWFDQRHTRQLLDWSPTVDLDTGFNLLAEHYAGR